MIIVALVAYFIFTLFAIRVVGLRKRVDRLMERSMHFPNELPQEANKANYPSRDQIHALFEHLQFARLRRQLFAAGSLPWRRPHHPNSRDFLANSVKPGAAVVKLDVPQK